MSKVILGIAGLTDGIEHDEAGMNIEKVTIKALQDVTVVLDKQGERRGKVLKNQRQEITISGETTAAPSQTLITALTVANLEDLGGVTTGVVTVTEMTLEKSRDGLQTLSISGERDPLITAYPEA